MAIQKRFIHFKKFSDFNSKKLSANEANTQYTVGVSGETQNGEPDILYQSYVWIKDTKQQWTHGQLYDGTDSLVTESTISEWGFTKNTGTYSKPSGGIPKSDLASAVQTSLGKADTALQSYTEQYKGTITGVSANGTSVATSGVANIPAASTSKYGVTKLSSATNSTSTTLAATASAVKAAYDLANGKQDKLVSGTNIKTINGTSILGSGDITISGGGDYLPLTGGTVDGDIVVMGTIASPTTIMATGGIQGYLRSGDSILGIEGGDIVWGKEYIGDRYYITANGDGTKFLSDDGTYKTISVGESSDANVQAVDTGDVIDDVTVNYATTAYVDGLVGDINSVLESIINGGGGVTLITFTIDSTEYQAESGMTWSEWVNSEYNTSNYIVNDYYGGITNKIEIYIISDGSKSVLPADIINKDYSYHHDTLSPL